MTRIKDDVRFPLELRNTSIGEMQVAPVSISQVTISNIPLTITGITSGAWASVAQVQAVADAVRAISALVKQ